MAACACQDEYGYITANMANEDVDDMNYVQITADAGL